MDSISPKNLSPQLEPISDPKFPSPAKSPDYSLIYLDLLGMIIACAIVSLLLFLANINFNHNHDHSHNRDISDSDLEVGEREGLAKEELEQLMPCVNYDCQDVAPSSNFCVICLENFVDGVSCPVFPICKHIFHSGRVDQWLIRHLTCPICRVRIVNS